MEITLEKFLQTIDQLEKGEIRVAEKIDGKWVVNKWVKEVILAGFKLGAITDMSQGQFSFFDKETFPVRKFSAEDGVRIVPGGSSIRRGSSRLKDRSNVVLLPTVMPTVNSSAHSVTKLTSLPSGGSHPIRPQTMPATKNPTIIRLPFIGHLLSLAIPIATVPTPAAPFRLARPATATVPRGPEW